MTAASAVHGDPAHDVVACRHLPTGSERAACFERTSEQLERALSQAPATVGSPSGAPQASSAARRPDRFGQVISAHVLDISYEDGAPVFRLDNGQTWVSRDQGRLSWRHDGSDTVEIDPSPVGRLLHFNKAHFGFLVVRRQ